MLDYVKKLRSGLYAANVYSSEFIVRKKCASKLLKSSADFFRTFSDSSWKQILHKMYKMTGDNQWRGFCYKAFDRILVPNKELKQFKIRNCDLCSQSKNPDSLEHTF